MNYAFYEENAGLPVLLEPSMSKHNDKTQHGHEVRVHGVLPIGDKNNVTIESVNALAVFEARVMDAVWALDREVAVAEILERMQNDVAAGTLPGEKTRRIAYTSVLTTVINLVEKGFLHQDRTPPRPSSKNAYMYRATMTKREYRDSIARSMAQAAMQISPMVATDTIKSWKAAEEKGQ